ncbi:hypothetical protein ABT336_03155 [Micromonospora sp. NPDC000207]|uniref:hypothetical protein n=1 Tax=Micromonospora sp. NPDC000207 TaxID=3154246 RepID=UPI0033268B44
MKRLWTPALLFRHVAMVVLVVGFLALGWWQISRAVSGNAMSWAYAFEWPIFAGFVVFVWWREVRHELRRSPDGNAPESDPDPAAERPTALPGAVDGVSDARPAIRRPVRVSRTSTSGAAEDGDLAAYNHYLSWLNANPGARPGDYPG